MFDMDLEFLNDLKHVYMNCKDLFKSSKDNWVKIESLLG